MTEEKNEGIMLSDEVVMTKIFVVRNQRVMIDRDLAELYGVETKRLKEAVRRNITRFPEDFMFEMTKEELQIWRSQFASSNSDKMGLRYPPFCFTEQGVTMLSCILNSQRAIQINIQVVRIFTKIREALLDNLSIRLDVEEIKKKIESQDKNIELVFSYLDELIEKQENPEPRRQIGYKRNNKD
ncbi:ORF6N domain-containing protein [Mariniphaga sediminis]|uniref:ORF6N domain-containing protein n=1 Tax=Mariniphaga sediminis TaxID=1628158 RepID=UPI003563920F